MEPRTVEGALRSIAELGGSKGFKTVLDEDKRTLRIYSIECPLEVVVEPSNGGFRVEFKVGENLTECIENLLEAELDPRDEIENIMESLISIVDYAVKKLASTGVKVERSTRQGVLDAYDAIESFLEED